MSNLCPVKITQELVRIKSITPDAGKCLDVVEKYMQDIGAKIYRKVFSGDGSYDVDNLYARIGSGQPHIMLVGHVDVVSVGNLQDWKYNPWGGEIIDGNLYGRGSADMKSGVACAICAISEIANDPNLSGSVSILITGDEEADAVNGSKKLLEYLHGKGEKWDCALTLEPTNFKTMGDQIKIGRRGSLTANVIVKGKQGHVGYPEKTNNAIHNMNKLIASLLEMKMDDGNDYFDPSSLQIVNICGGVGANNVVPGIANFTFNIRFSSDFTSDTLQDLICKTLDKAGLEYDMHILGNNRSFITEPNKNTLADDLSKVIEKISGSRPKYVTSGGTSDSRFVVEYCPVIDYGVSCQTIHQVDEYVPVNHINQLNQILIEYLKNKVC